MASLKSNQTYFHGIMQFRDIKLNIHTILAIHPTYFHGEFHALIEFNQTI